MKRFFLALAFVVIAMKLAGLELDPMLKAEIGALAREIGLAGVV